MSDRLMSADDLARVTGKKRYGKQVEWFRAQFGISIVRCGDGSPVITWATFEALLLLQNSNFRLRLIPHRFPAIRF